MSASKLKEAPLVLSDEQITNNGARSPAPPGPARGVSRNARDQAERPARARRWLAASHLSRLAARVFRTAGICRERVA